MRLFEPEGIAYFQRVIAGQKETGCDAVTLGCTEIPLIIDGGEEGGLIVLQNAPMYAYIPAKDLARARNFYEGKLGFKPKEVTPGGVIYEFANKTGCFLYPTPNAGTSEASQAFWQVDDIMREVRELKARGVQFEKYDIPGLDAEGIFTGGGAKAAWFKDSEGNVMAVIQNL